jgi:peptide/nickel transport system permease protein
MYGARISMLISFVVAAFELLTGGILGAVAAYYGGWLENIIMRFVDMISTIPYTLLCMCLVSALGTNMTNLIIALAIANIPGMTRIVRSTMLTVVEMEYIEAARACGTKDGRIILRHILPNGIGPIIVQVTRSISNTILIAAGLSYLGLGVQPPRPEWGAMLSEAREVMLHYPYLMLFPGCAIVIAALSFQLFGDGLRDALDPRLKD